jgi:glycerate dehydrogenase
MHIVVLDADTLGRDLDLSVFEKFGEATLYGYSPPDRIEERVQVADVVVTNKMRLHAGNLASAAHLKLICVTGTGTDGIDKAWCRERGIGVCNIKGYSTDSVVQHTFAMLFEMMERTGRLREYTRSGAYVGDTSFRYLEWYFHEVSGMRWGILGMGAIGSRVAHAAEAFGASIVYWSSTGTDRIPDVPRLELEELLRTCDVVSVHSPLTERTRGLLGARELSWMKPAAYLLNLGRGGIIDEGALAMSLKEGHLGGCALDVLEAEPMNTDSPLCEVLDCERLLITPHVAWASIEARRRCIDEVVRNIVDFLAGGKRNRCE